MSIISKEEYILLKPLRNYDPFAVYVGIIQLAYRQEASIKQFVGSYTEHFWLGYCVVCEGLNNFRYSYNDVLLQRSKMTILINRLYKLFSYYFENSGSKSTNIMNILKFTQLEYIKLSPVENQLIYSQLNMYIFENFKKNLSNDDIKLLTTFLKYSEEMRLIQLKLLKKKTVNIEHVFDIFFPQTFDKLSLLLKEHVELYKTSNPQRLSINTDTLLEYPFLQYKDRNIPLLNQYKMSKYTLARYLRTNYSNKYEEVGKFFEKFIYNIFSKQEGLSVIGESNLNHKASGNELCDLIIYTENIFVIFEIKYTIFNNKDKCYSGINKSLRKGYSQLNNEIKLKEIRRRFCKELENKSINKLLVSMDELLFEDKYRLDYPSVNHIQFDQLITLLYMSSETIEQYFEKRVLDMQKFDIVRVDNEKIIPGMKRYYNDVREILSEYST